MCIFMKKILAIAVFSCMFIALQAQPLTSPKGADTGAWQKNKYPTVFLIGDDSRAFEALSRSYNIPLINACEDDIETAFYKWKDMMIALENFSKSEGYDIRGIKMWIKIFWAADGSVEHIAYFLKPHSRNVSTEALSAFFKNFMATYKLPIEVERSFSHYGSVSFPTYYQITRP